MEVNIKAFLAIKLYNYVLSVSINMKVGDSQKQRNIESIKRKVPAMN